MNTYVVNVTREGKWWLVAIPEIDGLTQARRLSEAEKMAREYIAVTLGAAPHSFEVDLRIENVAGVDVAGALAEIRDERERVAALEIENREHAKRLAKSLAAASIPVRDIGTIMGVSFQRAHQLVSAR
jgi:predicted RNase H-like HicB family nuclease